VRRKRGEYLVGGGRGGHEENGRNGVSRGERRGVFEMIHRGQLNRRNDRVS